MAAWPTKRMDELCEITSSKRIFAADYVSEGVPFYRGREITEKYKGNLDVSTELFITEEKFQQIERKFGAPRQGDLLLTSVGTLGSVYVVKPGDRFYFKDGNLTWFRHFKELDSQFLYYWLGSPQGKAELQKCTIGSSQSAFTIVLLKSMEIKLPPTPIQRRIAGILSSYDELIENSQRRIKILESMARALYRQALEMGKEPVILRPIVESPYWRFISENVSDYHGTKRYFATADIDGLAVTGSGIDYSFAEKPSRAQKQPIPKSVWFARMKETYKIAWYGPLEDERVSGIVLSSGFAGFEAKDEELWPLLFLTISSREFHLQKDLYCTGATQMSLTNEGMARIVLPMPDEQSARRLGRTAGPMLNAIAVLQRQHENLRRTRDLLLPRLLFGHIDVESFAS